MVGQVGSDLPPRVHRDGRCGERRRPHGATAEPAPCRSPPRRTGCRSALRPRPPRRVEVKGKTVPCPRPGPRPQGRAGSDPRAWLAAGRARPRDGAAPRRLEGVRRGTHRLASRRGGPGQVPARRGDAAEWSRRPRGRFAHRRRDPPALGDLAMRLLRHDASVRAISAGAGAVAGIEDTDPPDEVRRKLAATIEPGRRTSGSNRTCACGDRCSVSRSRGRNPGGQAFRDAIMELVPARRERSVPTSRVC